MYKIFTCFLLVSSLAGCSTSDNAAFTRESRSLVSIPLELTTHLGDQQQFVEGDEIQFLLSLGSDAYIYMYYIDAANKVTQILPNREQIDNHYLSGYFLTIPEYENHYRFTVNEPFGEETVWIIASDRSIDIDGRSMPIEDIRKKIKRESGQAYGEYDLKISTRKK